MWQLFVTIVAFKGNGYTYNEDNPFQTYAWLPSERMSHLKGKKLLLWEQLLSFLVRPLSEGTWPALKQQEVPRVASFVGNGESSPFKALISDILNVRYHYENTPIQIYRDFHLQKLKIFRKKSIVVIFLLKIKIVGTCENCLGEAVLITHSLFFFFFFLSKDKKNNVYPCKPQFYYIKVEFKGVKII